MMSCRWIRSRPVDPTQEPCQAQTGSDAGSVYRELALARRKEDFLWFARSQGVPSERIESLWQVALTRVAVDRPATTPPGPNQSA
jgi:hypothetical protein